MKLSESDSDSENVQNTTDKAIPPSTSNNANSILNSSIAENQYSITDSSAKISNSSSNFL